MTAVDELGEPAVAAAPAAPGQGLVQAAMLVFIVGMSIAAALGIAVGATETRGGVSTLTEVPTDGDLAKSFNWLLFLLAAGPTLIATCVLGAGARIVNVVARKA